MNFYYNADENYQTPPKLVELTRDSPLYPKGTLAWYHAKHNDLWIIHSEGTDCLVVNGNPYSTTIYKATSFKFKSLAPDPQESETMRNIETLINANRTLNPLLDYDDRIYTQNLISSVIDSLRGQLKEDN